MAKSQNILEQPVSELDLRELIQVDQNTTVRQSVDLMREKSLGCVAIIDSSKKIVGKFTERGLIHLLLTDSAALDEPVIKHKHQDCSMVRTNDPISKLISIMDASKLRFVFVVDENDKPVGLTGQKGLMEYLADHFPRAIKSQTTESKLYMDQREGA